MSSSSSSATPTSSDAPSQSTTSSPSSGPSSTLYLLTFLATLFVLLFVSSAIVMRSFFLRRRFRRQIEEQIAAGLLPPEAALQLHNYRADLGEKPKLWDYSIVPAPDSEYTWEHWDDIEPVAARLLVNAPSTPADSPHPSLHPHYSLLHNPFAHLLSRNRSRPPEQRPSGAADTASEMSHDDHLPSYDDGAPIQITMLLQMPAPPRRARPPSEGGSIPIPEISIGVAQVPLRTGREPAKT